MGVLTDGTTKTCERGDCTDAMEVSIRGFAGRMPPHCAQMPRRRSVYRFPQRVHPIEGGGLRQFRRPPKALFSKLRMILYAYRSRSADLSAHPPARHSGSMCSVSFVSVSSGIVWYRLRARKGREAESEG